MGSRVSSRALTRARLPGTYATLALVWVGALCVIVASLIIGSVRFPAYEIYQTLVGVPPDETAETVIWKLRFPRAVTAVFAGALLALSGAVLQNMTRNSLADPSLIGVSQGASLAVVLAIVTWPSLPNSAQPVLAILGALAVAALIQTISMRRGAGSSLRFILTGIGIGAFCSACTSAALAYGDLDRAHAALGWIAGSVQAANWNDAAFLGVSFVVCSFLMVWASPVMQAMRLGPEVARGLGVTVPTARVQLTVYSVIAAAIAVAAVGPLGFVGLIAPHIAHRLVLQGGAGLHAAISAAVGACLVSIADLVGRVLFSPVQVPAGIVTALIGVPLFVWLLYNRHQNNAR